MPNRKVESEKFRVQSYLDRAKSFKFDKRTALIILVVGLLLLAYYKKSWFVAALVNGMPITNFELLSKMNEQYRSQTLNQMINEKLLLEEVREKGITVSEKELENKISELAGSLGGEETLDMLLSQQNQTRAGLRNQIRLQLSIEKLYTNEATVSAEELDKFLEENQDSLQATESAMQRKEAEETLKQQKITQAFNEKFGTLRQSAKIQIF